MSGPRPSGAGRKSGRQHASAGHRGRRSGARGSQGDYQGSAPGDPARRTAYDVLRSVAESDAYANLVLPPLLTERGITGRDAAFCTELTYGTLRMQGRYDAIVDLVSSRPAARLDAGLLDVLRLGLHQLLSMRVPTHAAVSETVALARTVAGTGPSGLANAVLRRLAQEPSEHWLAELARQHTGTEALAAVHSHPAWVVRAMRQALAEQADSELVPALEANNTPAPVTLAVRPGLAQAQDLTGVHTDPGRWAPGAAVLTSGDPGALAGVTAGRIGVQDEGSQVVTRALAGVPIDGPDSTWLDLCAGPGGKAALFGALLAERDSSGTLVANEVAPHRAKLVTGSTRSLAGHLPGLEVRTGDGRQIGESEPGRYDRVLVDAPCTGLGALRRRPESRWRRRPGDLAELGALQRDLLTSALHTARPGGVVAYITCSPHVAETTLVVQDVLRDFGHATLLDAAEAVQEVVAHPMPALAGPMVQLWPHRHGTDAMFLALIQR